MRLEIVAIGNSRGVRLPKSLLDQCGLYNAVEAEVRGKELVLKKIDHPRDGWARAFSAETHGLTPGDQGWLDAPSEWTEEEWQW
ncbi:MAG: AbrB/MazE/SpoVT family DNA-binding domain-containing protein [Alphaproteobacteria bacterium]|nr:AbrB/MazE/SpoVT family DNA-binding domain-containing protein [Alphaproteobacteria bacterium]